MRPTLRGLLAVAGILRGKYALMGMFLGVIPLVTGASSATGNAQHSRHVNGLQKGNGHRPSGRSRTKSAIAPTRNIASECGTMRLLGGGVSRQMKNASTDGAGAETIRRSFGSSRRPREPDVAVLSVPSPVRILSESSRLNGVDALTTVPVEPSSATITMPT